jgi:hypothetical protein
MNPKAIKTTYRILTIVFALLMLMDGSAGVVKEKNRAGGNEPSGLPNLYNGDNRCI